MQEKYSNVDNKSAFTVALSELSTAAKTPPSLPEQRLLVPPLCLLQVPRWLLFICDRKMVRQEHSERAARREERRVCVPREGASERQM